MRMAKIHVFYIALPTILGWRLFAHHYEISWNVVDL